MITILKTQREVLPAAKLIGKRYTDADRDDSGGFWCAVGAVVCKPLV